MKTSIWYRTADKLPNKSGFYVAYKSYWSSTPITSTGYYYYNEEIKDWRVSSHNASPSATIYYWSDADPLAWIDADSSVTNQLAKSDETLAVQAAWKNVQHAIEQYEIVKALTYEF